MLGMSATLSYLFFSFIAVTGVLFALVIYGNTLSTREDCELYLNQAEQVMMGSEQRVLVGRMHRLAHAIEWLAVLSGILLIATASVWIWIGFHS